MNVACAAPEEFCEHVYRISFFAEHDYGGFFSDYWVNSGDVFWVGVGSCVGFAWATID